MDVTNQNVPHEQRRPLQPKLILPLVALAALALYLYINAMWWWYTEWVTPGSFYAHGVFIPFFVGLMIWRDRERLRRLPISRSWWGMALVVVAIVLVLFAQRAQVTVTLSLSFILFLIGVTLLIAGPKITKALLFPYLFLLTMIPIVPDQLINPVAFPIQITSAKMATSLLHLVGYPAVRTGTQIKIESYSLDVELPCSGFKTLVGLLSFAAAFAWLVEAKPWKRWTLFLVAAPLAILVNGVRITLIGLVGELFSRQAAASFHDYSGFIVLILGFMFLFSLARALKCERFLGMSLLDDDVPRTTDDGPLTRDDTSAGDLPSSTVDGPSSDEQSALDARYGPPRKNTLQKLMPGLYPVLGVLVVACVLRARVEPPHSEYPPLAARQVPAELDAGAWRQVGTDRAIAPEVKEQLNPEGWIDRNYVATAPRTSSVNLLISAGSGRRVFHDPHTCFLGSGYDLRDLHVDTIDTPVGPVSVQVAEGENAQDHSKTLLMFLYVVDGKQIHSTQGVNWAIMWQTLLGGTGRPSYFLRFLQMSAGTDETRYRELRDFVRSVWTVVGPQVTGGAPARRTASNAP